MLNWWSWRINLFIRSVSSTRKSQIFKYRWNFT